MGEVKKIGDEYFIEFYARGLLYQQKAGTDRFKAVKMLKDIEEKIAQGEVGTYSRDVDVDIFFKTFLDQCSVQYGAVTSQRFETVSSHFLDYLSVQQPGAVKLSGVTPRVMELYRSFLAEQKDVRPQLVNFSLFLLREIFEFSIKLGYLNDNPMLHIQNLKEVVLPAPKVLDDREITEMLNKLDKKTKTMMKIILETGMTINEVLSLKAVSIDLSERKIRVMGREIFITPEVEHCFRVLVDTGSLFPEQTDKGDFDQVNMFVLRNMFIKKLLKRNVPLFRIYRILGLSDIAKVFRYRCWVQDKKI